MKIGDLGLATLLRARTAPQSVLGGLRLLFIYLWCHGRQYATHKVMLLDGWTGMNIVADGN